MVDTKIVKAALEEKLKLLQARAEEIEEDISATPDRDWDEDAIESEDDEVQVAIGNLAVQDISDIKLAIARIDAGDYGVCTTCNKKIPKARLQALPFATTCVGCA